MENPTPFDLNEAIRRWREQLAASPQFNQENLEELASHLRTSVQGLTKAGLAEEEAFLIASRRLGSQDDLRAEYGKLNHAAIWRERAFWVMGGMLALHVISSLLILIRFEADQLPGFGPGQDYLEPLPSLIAMVVFGLALYKGIQAGKFALLISSGMRLLQRPVWGGTLLFLSITLIRFVCRYVPHLWPHLQIGFYSGPSALDVLRDVVLRDGTFILPLVVAFIQLRPRGIAPGPLPPFLQLVRGQFYK